MFKGLKYCIFGLLLFILIVFLVSNSVLKNNKIAEVFLCYTGDILDKSKKKYDLNYYIKKEDTASPWRKS